MENQYFKENFMRENFITLLFLRILSIFEGPARLLLSVFIRHKFGERHFNIITASFLGLTMISPLILNMTGVGDKVSYLSWINSFNFFWFLFVVAYSIMAFRHHRDMGFSLTKYDFTKFSLHDGDKMIPWSAILEKMGIHQKLNPLMIEVVIEPMAFLIIGIVFSILPFTRAVGIVLILSSITYSASYFGAYWKSRNSILNKNDERICNEDMARLFVGDIQMPGLPENTRIKMPTIVPENREIGEDIYRRMTPDTVGVA